eukprot:693465-Prorocentrum_minimum.AAC.1
MQNPFGPTLRGEAFAATLAQYTAKLAAMEPNQEEEDDGLAELDIQEEGAEQGKVKEEGGEKGAEEEAKKGEVKEEGGEEGYDAETLVETEEPSQAQVWDPYYRRRRRRLCFHFLLTCASLGAPSTLERWAGRVGIPGLGQKRPGLGQNTRLESEATWLGLEVTLRSDRAWVRLPGLGQKRPGLGQTTRL